MTIAKTTTLIVNKVSTVILIPHANPFSSVERRKVPMIKKYLSAIMRVVARASKEVFG